MDFNLSEVPSSWRSRADALARALPGDAAAADVVIGAVRAGLLDVEADLLSAAVAVEAIACESASAAIAYGLHMAVLLSSSESGAPRPWLDALARGEAAGAMALAAEDVPFLSGDVLSGRASWVVPFTHGGIVIVGARRRDGAGAVSDAMGDRIACAASLDAPGMAFEPVGTSALRGLVCGHIVFSDVPCTVIGGTPPVMARARVLLAAAGLGMGRRAVRESLAAARAYNRTGAGGEQTVQGLLADAATEIDAAKLLTWKAASAAQVSLGEASMAKLAATDATQRAVARATQVIGGDSFRDGHIIERLARDVRTLELFAGRTEALRDAVAAETLPHANPS